MCLLRKKAQAPLSVTPISYADYGLRFSATTSTWNYPFYKTMHVKDTDPHSFSENLPLVVILVAKASEDFKFLRDMRSYVKDSVRWQVRLVDGYGEHLPDTADQELALSVQADYIWQGIVTQREIEVSRAREEAEMARQLEQVRAERDKLAATVQEQEATVFRTLRTNESLVDYSVSMMLEASRAREEHTALQHCYKRQAETIVSLEQQRDQLQLERNAAKDMLAQLIISATRCK